MADTDKIKDGSEEVTSDQLLSAFTGGGFFKWVVVAVIAHIIFIAVFSIGSIVKRFAPAKPAAEEEQQTAEAAPAANAAEGDAAAAANGETAGTASAPAKSAASSDEATDAEILKERAESPVVKRLTEAAKPEEIPSVPDDLGISLDDTQVR